ncbi:MAG: hypothetical protein ABI697_13430 [Devosia sp.]
MSGARLHRGEFFGLARRLAHPLGSQSIGVGFKLFLEPRTRVNGKPDVGLSRLPETVPRGDVREPMRQPARKFPFVASARYGW